MPIPLFTNNAATALAVAITPTDTVLQVVAGTGQQFPSPTGGNYFMLTLIQINNPEVGEIVKCIGRTGDFLTVERGQENTQPQIFNISDNVQLRITAQSLNLFAQGGGGGGGGSAATQVAEFTATQGQTNFTLPFTYIPDQFNLAVFVNGSKQIVDVNYSESSSTTITFFTGLNVGDAVEVIYNLPIAAGQLDASNILYDEGGVGAVESTVEKKLQQFVSVSDFGAVGDGVTDDTAAIQAAINYCATFTQWPILYLSGKHLISSSLIINRLVDNNSSEFIIIGNGPGQGFYTTTSLTMFDSTLTFSTAPVSEFVTFQNVEFSTSSSSNEVYVLSQKFLRIKFDNCFFYIVHCLLASIYVQTIYFINCNIRNTKNIFLNCQGLYDVSFNHCIIENGYSVVRSIDTAIGTNGLRFIDNVIEGIQSSIVVTTGASGFDLIGNHIEASFAPYFNFFAGGIKNNSINVIGNYFYVPSGAAFYYGPTVSVNSIGNTLTTGTLHSNANQVDNLVSIGDVATTLSDATIISVINGVTRAGATDSVWSDTANQITKDVNGNFGISSASSSLVRFLIKGNDQTSTNYGFSVQDSVGNASFSARNDRQLFMPALQNFANDSAAATGGIPVGGLYRNGSVVQVRVS
jgi:hypothetical protein